MKPFSLSSQSSWVEINLSRVKNNLQAIQEKIKGSAQIMAVVKADAYGHGLVPVARELIHQGVSALGVGSLEEALEIRKKVSPSIPVILLLGLRSEEIGICLRYRLTPVLYSLEIAQKLHRLARQRRTVIPIHIKIDTGMGRLGVPWPEFGEFLNRIVSLPGLQVRGLTSHFGQADEIEKSYNQLQWTRFTEALDLAKQKGITLSENHMANSAAVINLDHSHLHFIRPGILLYGADPMAVQGTTRPLRVKPVMTFKSRILQIKQIPKGVEVSYGGTHITSRPTTIALLPVGYANGYPRILSNRSQILIRGRRFPVLGRICMNLMVVQVDPRLQIQPGEEVVLMGSQGQEIISAEELAGQAKTISYELFCLLGRLNPRKYFDD